MGSGQRRVARRCVGGRRRGRAPGRRRHRRSSLDRGVQARDPRQPGSLHHPAGRDHRRLHPAAARVPQWLGHRHLRRQRRPRARRAVTRRQRFPRRHLPAVGGRRTSGGRGRHTRGLLAHRHRAHPQGWRPEEDAAAVQAVRRRPLRQRQAVAELDLAARRGGRHLPPAHQRRGRAGEPDGAQPHHQRRLCEAAGQGRTCCPRCCSSRATASSIRGSTRRSRPCWAEPRRGDYSSAVSTPGHRASAPTRSRGYVPTCAGQSARGTAHITSNSRPSGSRAYRLLLTP